jgi:hypothetical protein
LAPEAAGRVDAPQSAAANYSSKPTVVPWEEPVSRLAAAPGVRAAHSLAMMLSATVPLETTRLKSMPPEAQSPAGQELQGPLGALALPETRPRAG